MALWGKDRKLCILHHIYHSWLTYKVIITRLLTQMTLHVGRRGFKISNQTLMEVGLIYTKDFK